ncbi:MAG: hypothetical protein JXA23_10740 [Bacteroidales bacterium]|nr:hypothetical protein [Bacteroidales bacterium]
MKKLFFLMLFLIGNSFTLVYAINPIPSYKVTVYHQAVFMETVRRGNPQKDLRGERIMVVAVSGLSSHTAIIWVNSLDRQTTLGPYYVPGGETLYVEIDEREWGVLVESDGLLEVDVWIEEGGRENNRGYYLNDNPNWYLPG